MQDSEAIKALESLILYNPELEKLESMLDDFNVFETLDIVNAEIRHSNVMSWLFNPHENHNLGSYFIHNFLKQFISLNKSYISDLSIFDIEGFDYQDIEIRREWENIDLLILLKESHKQVAIVIENKVKSSEHSNQLQRYRRIVENHYPNETKLYLFLTPELAIPSDENWIPHDYGSISLLIDNLIRDKVDSVGNEILTFLNHYNTILKRYIVGNSEIEKICQDIYHKHQKALDLIFKYKPDKQGEISNYLVSLINSTSDTILDSYGKSVIRFTTPTFDQNIQKLSEGWSKSKRILLWEFYNVEDRLALRLYIGPGNQEYRNRLFMVFKESIKLFPNAKGQFGNKWHAVYNKDFVSKQDLVNNESEDLQKVIAKKWNSFVEGDLLKIDAFVAQIQASEF